MKSTHFSKKRSARKVDTPTQDTQERNDKTEKIQSFPLPPQQKEEEEANHLQAVKDAVVDTTQNERPHVQEIAGSDAAEGVKESSTGEQQQQQQQKQQQKQQQQQQQRDNKKRRRRTRSREETEDMKKLDRERKRVRNATDRRAFREQIMQHVETDGLLVSPQEMLLMLLDHIRDHHEKVAQKCDTKKKFDSEHPCSLVRTIQHTYDAVMPQLKVSIEKSFAPRLIENTKNRKNEATITGLEQLISLLDEEEKEWMKVDELLLGGGVDGMSDTLLDKPLAEKVNTIPELHPDGSMNDQISQALYSQTEKVDDATIMMTHMTHFSNKVSEGARSMTRKLGQDLKRAQEARAKPQDLITKLVKPS